MRTAECGLRNAECWKMLGFCTSSPLATKKCKIRLWRLRQHVADGQIMSRHSDAYLNMCLTWRLGWPALVQPYTVRLTPSSATTLYLFPFELLTSPAFPACTLYCRIRQFSILRILQSERRKHRDDVDPSRQAIRPRSARSLAFQLSRPIRLSFIVTFLRPRSWQTPTSHD
jgi:hypothetical protein